MTDAQFAQILSALVNINLQLDRLAVSNEKTISEYKSLLRDGYTLAKERQIREQLEREMRDAVYAVRTKESAERARKRSAKKKASR